MASDRTGELAAAPAPLHDAGTAAARDLRWVRPLGLALLAAALALIVVLFVRVRGTGAGFDPRTNAEALAPLVLAGVVALGAAGTLLARPERRTVPRLSLASAAWSVALLLGLAGLWYLMVAQVRPDAGAGLPIRSVADLRSVLAERAALRPGAPPPIPVPTGVLIQSIEFLNATDVQVTGYAWQVVAPDAPADVEPGFIVPDAIEGGYGATEATRFAGDGVEFVVWRLDVTLRHPFSYRRYPFDRQDVALRLWHADTSGRLLLVPDTRGEQVLTRLSLTGLAPDAVFVGWEPVSTLWSYAPAASQVGARTPLAAAQSSEIFFTIGLKRDFASPFFNFVSYFAVLALLLFAVLCLTTEDAEKKGRWGISTFGVVGTCSGLLFASILKHNELRAIIGPQQLAYLELLPALINLAIVLVALNALLLASPLAVRFVRYRDNLLPNLLFWPALLGLLLAFTVFALYR